jgi:phosphoribosylformimino-5-aminoimidazole carboxamide ribotide isomerase
MILLPAIDLMDGRCVRLEQGDFARVTAYSDDPAAALAAFADAGASEVHLVDLDGARAREPRQHDLFISLAKHSSLTRIVEPEGARSVIGSLALDDPDTFAAMLDRFGPDRLTLALDVRIEDGEPMVATHGWLTGSGRTLESVLADFPTVKHLLVTDIGRDGMLAGPNLELTMAIARRYPSIALQASGGVAGLDDLALLRDAGAARAIVGKALWEGRFDIAEGLARACG